VDTVLQRAYEEGELLSDAGWSKLQ
jgi:hypothetical protein